MFDKQLLGLIRADLNAALSVVGKKHGIDMSIGSISYAANSFTTKITAVSKNAVPDTANGVDIPNIKWKKSFLDSARSFGLQPTDLGKVFTSRGVEYALVGARPRATLPLVGKPLNGGTCIAVSAQTVKLTLK